MAGEVKLTGPSMEQRIANRLRNSGEGSGADVHTQQGNSAQRVHHNIHMTGNVSQKGPPEGTVRGPAGPIGAPAMPKADGKR
jgi:hypothetical protein